LNYSWNNKEKKVSVINIATTGNESDQHTNAKRRLHQIIEDMGFIADFEISTGTTKTEIGERNYTVDLFAFWTHAPTGVTHKIAFEVEGFKGHNSNRQHARDNNRDKAHLRKGIFTVRINMKDLVGKKQLDDNTHKHEIIWQLVNQGLNI
jgi:hypothetical protein